jgi:formate hydrogenlyase subunit 3/multisubunit Na+/H+ antiporter MnhD subunit
MGKVVPVRFPQILASWDANGRTNTCFSYSIHAAMKIAGIFSHHSFDALIYLSSYTVLNLIAFVGSVTAFFAATTGLFQNDMKILLTPHAVN